MTSALRMDGSIRQPPAVVVGGGGNALSIAWSLGPVGIRVYALAYPHEHVQYSRFARWINVAEGNGEAIEHRWLAYLMGSESEHLRGAVVLGASDDAIEMIARHHEALRTKFILDLQCPAAHLCMLNKLATYEAAQAADVPTPKFWVIQSRDHLQKLGRELVFPLVLKPLCSLEFKRRFKKTFVVASGFDELLQKSEQLSAAGVAFFLVELIPGPDHNLCSYYTYLDENGVNLFDYTKRVIRRFPTTLGPGCYHITDRVGGVAELSLRLFRHVGLRGIGNAEFKLDERDGQLKLVECNPRFTAADCLLTASGLNLSLFVYNRLTNRSAPAPTKFRTGLRLWYPINDFRAFRQLHAKGLLSIAGWVRSILHPQILPYFRWYDPLPSLAFGFWRTATWLRESLRQIGARRDRFNAPPLARSESVANVPALGMAISYGQQHASGHDRPVVSGRNGQ